MSLQQKTLEELFGEVMFASVVTHQDRKFLQSAILCGVLSDDQHAIINRLLYNVRRGWVKIL